MHVRTLCRRQFAVVMIATLATGCGKPTPPPTGHSETAYLLVIDRRGDRVDADAALAHYFDGGGFAPYLSVVRAACANGQDFSNDVSLDTTMLVAWQPRLVRAAELLADRSVERALAFAVESRLAAVDGDLAQLGPLAGFDPDVVSGYLALRGEPPSPDAEQRFVVYAVQRNLWTQRIVFFDPEAPTGHSGGSEGSTVHFPDGTERHIDGGKCAALALDSTTASR